MSKVKKVSTIKKKGVKSPKAAKPRHNPEVKKVSEVKSKRRTDAPKKYKKNTKTRKQMIEDNLKTKKLGSNARRVAYKEMGLKQDHTTTGHGSVKGPKKAGVKKLSTSGVKVGKVKTATPKTKKQVKATVKAAKAKAKGKAAIKAGNQRKALRMRKKYDRQVRRAKK